MPALTTIGFDADDTLWQNEAFFRITQDRFTALLADHAEADEVGRLVPDQAAGLRHAGAGAGRL